MRRTTAAGGSSPSAVIRSVLKALHPDLDDRPRHYHWGAGTFLQLQRPLVYVQVRDGRVLYVGSGQNLSRPLSAHHHKLRVEHGDRMELVWCRSLAEARQVETLLIKALRPELNGAPAPGVNGAPGRTRP